MISIRTLNFSPLFLSQNASVATYVDKGRATLHFEEECSALLSWFCLKIDIFKTELSKHVQGSQQSTPVLGAFLHFLFPQHILTWDYAWLILGCILKTTFKIRYIFWMLLVTLPVPMCTIRLRSAQQPF